METSSWDELVELYLWNVDAVEVWLVGPEMSGTRADVKRSSSAKATFHVFKGNVADFFRAHTEILSKDRGGVVVVGLNCGFGNFDV